MCVINRRAKNKAVCRFCFFHKLIHNIIKNAAADFSAFTAGNTVWLVTKAVVAGGVIPHRMGLSETVLIYETHIACMGGLDVFLERYPQQKSHFCEKKVFVETTSAETALRCLSVGVDAIQFFQMQPDALAAAVEQVKAAYPHCTVVAAGNLTEENVTEYAATGVDGLVSSAFYRAEPIQMQAQFHTN